MNAPRTWVDRALGAFGVKRHEVVEEGHALRVLLRQHGERRSVGILTTDGDEWTFAYDPAYIQDPDAPAISAFPDKTVSYRSKDLWPFFGVRLPSTERQDIREVMERRGLRESDKLQLLGALSRKAVTSPWEFELST